ncbi:NAD(P)/FAD-dependent oxidoreductase [Collinsella sp. An307]|uniref:NAD(P)/FAD-dependent oxidoreductase n=1 Tax=Collinsella sp. An307 TaxID=1965630 RepID=UPI000B37FECF|nr:NAD(P)/FAD-dependent oxidoreductase [Collinsella sp. An307]OUO21636.1 hypothetical protein B5F89_01970 [Collinsella sp. An307]
MDVHAQYDVVVIGGGASGLAAALAAAREGAHVVILERDVACGLPILATGNGRCNLSAERLGPEHYRHPDIARAVMGEEPERTLEAFFASVGILTMAEEGRLYPYSKRAESVRDALLAACEREGVEFRRGCDVVASWRDDAAGAWALTLREPVSPLRAKRGRDAKATLRAERRALEGAARREAKISARTVVLAPGGRSEGLCELFGVPHLPERPVLCPVAGSFDASPHALERLDGLRAEARLSLVREGDTVWQEEGEVLFRPYGISGIVSFDASRRVRAGDKLALDVFPAYEERELAAHLAARETVLGSLDAASSPWFDGLLARPLAELVLAQARENDGGHPSVSAIAHAAKRLVFTVEGTAEERQAQVRRGGIPFDAVDSATLACAEPHLSGVYACGEALDMDADCGGFNLAWAWTSGLVAGSAAAREATRQ